MNKLHMNRRGFSLVELLIATAISLIIGSAVILLLVQQAQLTATQNRNMINSEQVRSVLNFMSDEIQMMGNGIPDPNSYIVLAEPQQLIFYSDIDNDGTRDRIRYFVQGNGLNRTLSTSSDAGITWTVVGTDTLIPNLLAGSTGPNPGLRFEYFGINNGILAGTPPVANVRAVRILIGLDTTATTTAVTAGKVASQNMVTFATIRNRRL